MTGHLHRIIVTATALLALAPGAPRASEARSGLDERSAAPSWPAGGTTR